MRLLFCCILLVSCVSESEPVHIEKPPIVNRTVEDPFPYDDLVYGDSFLDEDGDGESTELDCDDNNSRVYTGAFEECNGLDDNCNGFTDEAGACL